MDDAFKVKTTETHDLPWFDNNAYVHPYSDLLLMVLLFFKIVFFRDSIS